MKAFLATALTLALSAPIALAEPAAPKDSHAPYHDPCDCIQGTKIQSAAPKPSDSAQDPYDANSITRTKPVKREKPLGMG